MGKFVKDLMGGNLFKGDKGVWMIYFFLCMISLVEVYSASSRLTFDGGHHWGPMVSQDFCCWDWSSFLWCTAFLASGSCFSRSFSFPWQCCCC